MRGLLRRCGAVAAIACCAATPVLGEENGAPATVELSARDRAREDANAGGNGDLHRVQDRQNGRSAAPPVGRRSLSTDERRALHRDLRDAMKGAYPERTP